ncbi:hypothetical protein FB45DRAFT_920647 [Roridomyces roridus]|uniref:Uncharacterized protein n=1 Tax=Roridomyces roridus TaxID=1738132 RepID=A0AAD7FJ24_9AGAR|nr:hypothetical protein FB45DRAFT_920647 [Roridomyces roridus]
MSITYVGGVAPIVTTQGPGNLHHMAYSSGLSTLPAFVGFVPTSNEGVSTFLPGFSYHFGGIAFYWEGPGDAFVRVGNSTQTEAVGNSWSNATGVVLSGTANGEIVVGVNVASTAANAENTGDGPGRIVAYTLPAGCGGLD